MKVAILAGGKGTRLAEETEIRPKPMVTIGGMPILWHIMRHYAHYGHKDFYIALGYKSEVIKRYIVDHTSLQGDITVDLAKGSIQHGANGMPELDWMVHLVETGEETQTGGRIKRLAQHIGRETFMLTWGDGVSNVDLEKLLAFHKKHGKLATITAVRPPARYGRIDLEGDKVARFAEKPQLSEGWINGAFFVLEPKVFDYIDSDDTSWEKGPLEQLAREGQLMAYCHDSFWQCMDTLREKHILEELWATGNAPWKVWR
jgi:glucose-1-phosphate cytidylyltransferase